MKLCLGQKININVIKSAHRRSNLTTYSNNFRIPKWYKITEKDIDNVWTPDVMFLNVVETGDVKFWGKSPTTYDFWLQTRHDTFNLNYKAVLLTFKKAMKVTFTCDFDFGHYPYDSHVCNFDFGIPGVK